MEQLEFLNHLDGMLRPWGHRHCHQTDLLWIMHKGCTWSVLGFLSYSLTHLFQVFIPAECGSRTGQPESVKSPVHKSQFRAHLAAPLGNLTDSGLHIRDQKDPWLHNKCFVSCVLLGIELLSLVLLLLVKHKWDKNSLVFHLLLWTFKAHHPTNSKRRKKCPLACRRGT